jgi:hypothetical protein
MYYYVVNKIGTGAKDDPFRPDVTEGIAYVNQPCDDGMCLVATATPIPNLTPMSLEGLEYECNMRGFLLEDVQKWFAR